MQDHWERIAAQVRRMGPPQAPHENAVARYRAVIGVPDGLTVQLGVTPALADLARPLRAFDSNAEMIRALWPGDTGARQAEVGDWRALPLASASVACMIGDGALNSVLDGDILAEVLAECRRVLKPGGCAAFRVYARPERCPSLADVLSAAQSGRAESLNVLRWQIASALAEPPDFGVPVARILAAAEAGLGPLARFAARVGLDPDEADYFENYRGSQGRYLFPPRSALAKTAATTGFGSEFVETEGYPGAADCPIAVFRPDR